jgi:hypothetical protein
MDDRTDPEEAARFAQATAGEKAERERRQRIAEDYREGRVVFVSGWIISETEAGLAGGDA